VLALEEDREAQRIYGNDVSLAKIGINVRGRSRKLTLNYRTTQEILALAVPTLGKPAPTGLDDEADTLDGHRSPLHGRRPEVHAATSREAPRLRPTWSSLSACTAPGHFTGRA
jgi:hypothetical protein